MNVRLACANPPASIDFVLGDGEITYSGGYGGWEEIERPKRSPIINWKGAPARRLQLPLLLEGFADDSSVEGDILTLSILATANGLTEPPKVSVEGTGIPGSGIVEWVIDDLQWKAKALNDDGYRTRIEIDLTLLEAIGDDAISETPRKPAKTYKVQKGDTLTSIASKELGFAGRWREIVKLNPEYKVKGKKKKRRDPKDLRVGETLRLP